MTTVRMPSFTEDYRRTLDQHTANLQQDYSRAVEGLNAFWGVFGLSDEEYKTLKARLEENYHKQFDYWRKVTLREVS